MNTPDPVVRKRASRRQSEPVAPLPPEHGLTTPQSTSQIPDCRRVPSLEVDASPCRKRRRASGPAHIPIKSALKGQTSGKPLRSVQIDSTLAPDIETDSTIDSPIVLPTPIRTGQFTSEADTVQLDTPLRGILNYPDPTTPLESAHRKTQRALNRRVSFAATAHVRLFEKDKDEWNSSVSEFSDQNPSFDASLSNFSSSSSSPASSSYLHSYSETAEPSGPLAGLTDTSNPIAPLGDILPSNMGPLISGPPHNRFEIPDLNATSHADEDDFTFNLSLDRTHPATFSSVVDESLASSASLSEPISLLPTDSVPPHMDFVANTTLAIAAGSSVRGETGSPNRLNESSMSLVSDDQLAAAETPMSIPSKLALSTQDAMGYPMDDSSSDDDASQTEDMSLVTDLTQHFIATTSTASVSNQACRPPSPTMTMDVTECVGGIQALGAPAVAPLATSMPNFPPYIASVPISSSASATYPTALADSSSDSDVTMDEITVTMGQTMDVTTCVGGIQFQGHNLSQGSPGATVNSPEALSMDLTTCVPQSTVPTTQEINSSQWTALVFEHPVEPAHTLEPIASPDADDTMATMDGMDMTECLGGIQVVAPCISLERTTIPSPELLSEALPQDSTSESVTDADVTMGVGTATLSPQPTGQTSTDNEPPIPITPVAAAGQPLPPCTPQSRRRPPRATLRKIGQSVGPVRNTDHCRRRSVGLGGSFATPPRRAERLSVQDLRRRQAKASPATLSAHTTPSDRPTTALGLLAASPGTPIINPRFSPLRLTPRAKTVGAAEHLLATPAAQLLEPIVTSVPPETKPEQALPNILATQGGQPELSKSSAIPGSPAIADTADTNVTLDISQVEIDPTAGVLPPFALEYPASPLTALSPIDKLTEQSPSTKKPSAITSPVRSPKLVDSPLAAIPPASKNLASTTTPLSARSVQPTSAPSPTIPDSVSEELQPTTTLAKSVQAYSPVTNTLLTSEAVAAIFPDPPSEVAKAYSHEDEPSLPGPISLADFLEMTGIRFLDDLEATAKRLPVPIHDSVAPGDDSTSVRDWLQQRIQTATTTLPKLELFQFLCTELEQYIRDGQRTIQKLERELQVNNPTSVLEYLLAPGAERLDLEQYFLRLKTHARLQAKKTWYTWREILVKPVIASYTESATALREDDQALQQMASSLAALTFTGQSECRKSHQMSQYLLEYKQNLVQQLQTVRERKDTIAKCDQEQLQSLHREIAEQSTVLSRYRHELADLQQQHVDQQVVLNRLVEEKTTLQRTIADAQNLSKSHQFYKATDLQSIKAEVESLCTVHGVRFTDVLPHECQLTYRRALAITIPRGQHFATAPIQLQVVSPGPSALTMAAEDLAVWRQVVADIAQQVNEPMVKANLTPRASLTKLLGQWHMVEQLQADIHLVRAQFPTELVYLSESHLLQIKVLFFNFASRTRFYLVFWMRSPLQAYPLPQLEWEFENVYGSTSSLDLKQLIAMVPSEKKHQLTLVCQTVHATLGQ